MVGELIADRYRVLELLRTSGLARTYRGLDEASNEEVALVLVPVPPEPRHLFREFAIGSRLSHPSLLRYRGTVESGDCAGLVVEPVVGLPLYGRMSQPVAVAVEQVNTRAFRQLCDVVDYLHSENLVHGNLAPDNLLVQLSGPLKLLDLGHCEDLAEQERFWHGEPHGTPRYSSPEHFSGPLAPESDYFVVGVLLCEYLSGAHPFPAHALADVLSSIRAGAARALLPRHLIQTALAASVTELLDLDFAVRRAGWRRLRHVLSRPDAT